MVTIYTIFSVPNRNIRIYRCQLCILLQNTERKTLNVCFCILLLYTEILIRIFLQVSCPPMSSSDKFYVHQCKAQNTFEIWTLTDRQLTFTWSPAHHLTFPWSLILTFRKLVQELTKMWERTLSLTKTFEIWTSLDLHLTILWSLPNLNFPLIVLIVYPVWCLNNDNKMPSWPLKSQFE